MLKKSLTLPKNRFLRYIVLLFLGFVVCLLILVLVRQWLVKSELALKPLLLQELLEFPTDLAEVPGHPGRMFVLEKEGLVKHFEKAVATIGGVVLDLKDRVDGSTTEEGLLGIAFHPNFQKNQYFYLYYTAKAPLRIRLSRFTFLPDSNTAAPASEKILFEIPKPNGRTGHNGGQIVFGPDGFLYVAIGQGNGHKTAQSKQTLLGKILRLDVSNPDSKQGYAIPPDNPFVGEEKSLGEIWAYGLRNPWRFSFDKETGNLYAGDVGHIEAEEVNYIEKGKNYGWHFMEGEQCRESEPDCNPAGLTLPMAAFPRWIIRVVIGGFVYRGENISWLQGEYVFGDYFRGLYSIPSNPTQTIKIPNVLLHEPKSPHPLLLGHRLLISSLAQDAQGELYALDLRGAIYQIVDL